MRHLNAPLVETKAYEEIEQCSNHSRAACFKDIVQSADDLATSPKKERYYQFSNSNPRLPGQDKK